MADPFTPTPATIEKLQATGIFPAAYPFAIGSAQSRYFLMRQTGIWRAGLDLLDPHPFATGTAPSQADNTNVYYARGGVNGERFNCFTKQDESTTPGENCIPQFEYWQDRGLWIPREVFRNGVTLNIEIDGIYKNTDAGNPRDL